MWVLLLRSKKDTALLPKIQVRGNDTRFGQRAARGVPDTMMEVVVNMKR